jgi:hypothetical protein
MTAQKGTMKGERHNALRPLRSPGAFTAAPSHGQIAMAAKCSGRDDQERTTAVRRYDRAPQIRATANSPTRWAMTGGTSFTALDIPARRK